MDKLKLVLIHLLLLGTLAARDFASDRILFSLKPDTAPLQLDQGKVAAVSPQMQSLFKAYGVVKISRWLKSADEKDVYNGLDFSKIYRVTFKNSKTENDIKKIVGDFESLPEVNSARTEGIYKICTAVEPYIPNDPLFSTQWYLTRISADLAWGLWNNSTPGDPAVLVGVVDTGLDYTHPDLKNRVYINPGEDLDGDGRFTSADSNGIDDDGNGFIDDVRGWDFAGADNSFKQDNDVRPPSAGSNKILSHGTHVAGVIAAEPDNALGIAGISFQSKIIATKQTKDNDVDHGYLYDAYDGILYCAKMGASVINCSWGGTYASDYERDLVNYITDSLKSIIVCAAGNDNTNNDSHHFYPSDHENTIAVAALSNNDQKAGFSNYGNIIDISAPGTSIMSTIHANAGSYASWQGTSMASPVIAGAFALLKAWFPDKDREDLIQTLFDAADNIDAVNPAYAGRLGAGRVNIYRPIAQRIFPNIKCSGYEYSILNDTNQDLQLSPGEQAQFKLNLTNKSGWQDAAGITVTLSSKSADIIFADSIAALDMLTAGTVDSVLYGSLSFKIDEDSPYQPILINIRVTANSDSLYPYMEQFQTKVNVSSNQKGFPVTDISVTQPLAVAKFKPGSGKGIVVIDGENNLNVFDQNGVLFPGFPVSLNGYTNMAPVIADLTGDGNDEIALLNHAGLLQVFRFDGSLWMSAKLNTTIYGSMSLSDLDGDKNPEFVFGSMDKKLHAIKLDGSELAGFPVPVSSFITHGVALADFNGDNLPELVFGTYDGKLHVLDRMGTELAGWPLSLNGRAVFTPLVVNGENEYRIIVITSQNRLELYDQNTNLMAAIDLTGTLTAPASVNDIDGDGAPEIMFPTDDGLLHIINLSGEVFGNAPFELNGIMRQTAIFTAANGQNRKEIICGTEDGRIQILNPDGQNISHYPAYFEGDFSVTPVIADLDNDGLAELIGGGHHGLEVLKVDVKVDTSAAWNTFLGDNQRTGFYQNEGALALEANKPKIANDFILQQNYPNPFNPTTVIRYQLSAESKVQLLVYNTLGQKISTLVSSRQRAGEHTIFFKALGLPSGIYLYKLTAGKNTQMRKMIYLK